MFKKLLSNLAFNPSLIGQVAFYAKRLHKEAFLRRAGMVVFAAAMFVQIFASVWQPESTLAASSNDILRGGFQTKAEAVNACRTNTQSFATILDYYHVDCDQVAGSSVETISSIGANKAYDSLGRNPQGPTIAKSGKPTNEYGVAIAGHTYYMKNLWSWDTHASSSYQVLRVVNRDGTVIRIMYDCGNIVTVGQYTPPVPKPEVPKTPQKRQLQVLPDVCDQLPGLQTSPEQCDVCSGIPGVQTTPEQCDVCTNLPGTQTSTEQCDVCTNLPGTQTDSAQCYPCEKAKTDSTNNACLEYTKTAANPTQGIGNANGTTAHAGDTIVYSLSVKNTGNNTVRDFRIQQDHIADILDYATIVDYGGGNQDNDFNIAWPKLDIAPGQTVTKTITVKIKDVIPDTPSPASDPGSFDLVMTNVFYGKTVNIKLPASTIKTVSVVTQELPNTGPGTSVMVGGVIAVFVAYFFARARLMAKELDIVRSHEQTTAGSF